MMSDTIMIEMDAHKVLWYLEGCAHGSHLRQGCWHDMIKLYPKMSQEMRDFLFTYAKRNIVPLFEVGVDGHRPCGAEEFDQFLACFDKDNWYLVTSRKPKECCVREAYLYNGKYYISECSYFERMFIKDIKKIVYGND